ncbi:MAG: hypothetical protein ABWW66_07905 [Archaeoglobaceae archaeon]
MKYIVKKRDKIKSNCEEFEELFEKLSEKVNSGIMLTKEAAIYFERGDDYAVLVSVEREKAGLAKLKARKLVESVPDFQNLEEAFKFAEEVEKMDLDDIAKFLR